MDSIFWRTSGEFDHIANGRINGQCTAGQTARSGPYDTAAHVYRFATQRIAPIGHTGGLHCIGD
ncbi:hypothetical protein D3C81_2123900 [compost metagenome]